MKVGDIVVRKSYGKDIFFRVVAIRGDKIILRGMLFRIEADAPKEDLVVVSEEEWRMHEIEANSSEKKNSVRNSERVKNQEYRNEGAGQFQLVGKVLHLDGDKDYLDACKAKYDEEGVPSVCIYVEVEAQPQKVASLLQIHQPDILVLTGHDSLKKGSRDINDIKNYVNSSHYINAVKAARKYEQSFDNLIIFAGACQSFYSAIIQAGANYASSPQRVLIHCLT